MHNSTPLIATIATGLVLAFAFGIIANKLRISPLIGYLLAGVIVGPYTPGYIADQGLSHEISEIGVMLLMFGVGLHFSLKDLLSVKNIAIPGALVQIGVATLMGLGLSVWLGWSIGTGIVFGLALSVASTVVLLRALEERNLVDTQRGRIAVGWLIVEDIVMVLALVLLPALAGALGGDAATSAGMTDIAMTLGLTLLKVSAFVAIMLIFGRRFIPWLLEKTAATGSRELFTLAVLAIALGVAYGSSTLFGVSFALGAFFAGMILNESELSHEAAEDSLPLRDAFAVLFFVSVGMLFNPAVLLESPLAVLATVFIIVVGKSLAAYLIVIAFGRSRSTALTVSASLAQIGEFSFILATLGISLGLLNDEARDLILAGAILSILLNPLMFLLGKSLAKESSARPESKAGGEESLMKPAGHTVLVGYGRVGHRVTHGFTEGNALVVIEFNPERAEEIRSAGLQVVHGNATRQDVLESAAIGSAKTLLIAIPNAFEAGHVVSLARQLNPGIDIIARASSDEEVAHLEKNGADLVIMGEHEIAAGMYSRAQLPSTSVPT